MDIRAAEISAILKEQIKNFGAEADVSDVGQVLSVVEVGAQVVNHVSLDQPPGGALHGFAVVAGQRQQVELKLAAVVLQALVLLKILGVKTVAFRVGEDGPVSPGAQLENIVM